MGADLIFQSIWKAKLAPRPCSVRTLWRERRSRDPSNSLCLSLPRDVTTPRDACAQSCDFRSVGRSVGPRGTEEPTPSGDAADRRWRRGGGRRHNPPKFRIVGKLSINTARMEKGRMVEVKMRSLTVISTSGRLCGPNPTTPGRSWVGSPAASCVGCKG